MYGFLIIVGILFGSSPAGANPKSGKRPKTTSAEQRQKTSCHFLAQYGEFPKFHAGGTAGFFLSDRLIIEGNLAVSSITDRERDGVDAYSTVAGVDARFFLSNSIYTMLGFGNRRITHRKYDGYDYESKIESIEYSDDVGVQVAAGNMWYHRGFVIGLDWAWFHRPIQTYKHRKKTYDKDGNEVSNQKLENDNDNNNETIVLPRLNIGFSF